MLAHMVPTFLTLAAPLCKPHRIPLGLWYTHWNADPSLRLATRLADVVLSVDRAVLPAREPQGCAGSATRSTSRDSLARRAEAPRRRRCGSSRSVG